VRQALRKAVPKAMRLTAQADGLPLAATARPAQTNKPAHAGLEEEIDD
jgi:hypothetical protein